MKDAINFDKISEVFTGNSLRGLRGNSTTNLRNLIAFITFYCPLKKRPVDWVSTLCHCPEFEDFRRVHDLA